jgi:hypothetical protein
MKNKRPFKFLKKDPPQHVKHVQNQQSKMVSGLQEGIVAEIHSLVGAVQHNGRYVQEILRYMRYMHY